MRMRISLIFPNLKLRKHPFFHVHFHQPLGLAYLAAVLKKEKHDVQVIDALAENLSCDEILNRINHNTEVIGISTNISSGLNACVLSRKIRVKFKHAYIIMGGPWATTEYEHILIHNYANFVVIGEGEKTVVELLQNLPEHDGKLKLIKGIAYMDSKNGLVKTEPRPLIKDLDSIPFPAWELFPPYNKYPFLKHKEPQFPIITSRGCPLDCNHCTKHVHGYEFRKRSVENVIKEIIYLKRNFGLGQVLISDDNFSLDKKRALKILDEIISRKFNISINFGNGLRADTVDWEFSLKMKQAGVKEVAFGIESGNQEIVNKIGKKLNLISVVKAVRMLKKLGINTQGFFILGHPWDTKETMWQTLTFAKQIDIDHTFFFRAIAFPGTKLYELVKKEGNFLNENASNMESYNLGNATFEIWNMKNKDLNRAFLRSYALFFLRPRKILRLMRIARSYHEVKWLLNVFLDFIYNFIDKFIGHLIKIKS